MTNHTTRRRPRADPTVGPQLSRIPRSGVCRPAPVRTHLPGTPGTRPHPAAAAVLALRLRPVRHRSVPRTGQYGPPYPPGEPPEGPPTPKSPRWLWVVAAVAVLLVVGLVIALVVVNSSKQDTVVAPPPMPEPTTTTTRTPPTTTSLRPLPPIVPVPTPSTTPPSESATPGRDRVGGLRGHRDRQGDQHHLCRHGQRAADGVQRRAAVAQGSRIAQSGRGFGEPDDHQRGPPGVLLRDGQRRPGAVEHRQRPDDLHRRRASAPEPGAARVPAPSSPCPRPAPAPDHRCLPEPRRTSR